MTVMCLYIDVFTLSIERQSIMLEAYMRQPQGDAEITRGRCMNIKSFI